MIFRVSLAIALLMTLAAWAYSPMPVQKSAAEMALTEALANAATDAEKLRLAKEAFEANPEDIPLGRIAQDVILKQMENPVDYYKARIKGNASIPAYYLYGRASGDTTIMLQMSRWILATNPTDFWGSQLAAIAEWERANPNMKMVKMYLEFSVKNDPSRPEGYLNLGYFFQDEENWQEARKVLEAGAVCDPANTAIRDARLTVYAHQRDGAAYFNLLRGAHSETPLEPNLKFANRSGKFTTADITGHFTVLEYWAYTCGTCLQRSLPEMNEAKRANRLPFQLYALHRGGEHEKARKIVEGKDAKGNPWALDFVWSSHDFEKQLGGVKGLPSYYVLDPSGRVRAVVKGHAKGTLDTIKWLIDEIGKQG